MAVLAVNLSSSTRRGTGPPHYTGAMFGKLRASVGHPIILMCFDDFQFLDQLGHLGVGRGGGMRDDSADDNCPLMTETGFFSQEELC